MIEIIIMINTATLTSLGHWPPHDSFFRVSKQPYEPCVETCMDMLARYAYNEAAEQHIKQRPAAIEALFIETQTRSWLYVKAL